MTKRLPAGGQVQICRTVDVGDTGVNFLLFGRCFIKVEEFFLNFYTCNNYECVYNMNILMEMEEIWTNTLNVKKGYNK